MHAGDIKTTCPYCGVGCGVIASVAADGAVSVRGDPDHPANFGRLCSKGSALAETLELDGRLLYPEINCRSAAPTGRVSWDAALDHVAQEFQNIIATHGPDAVAFYVSGQLCTEDYYVANKLMKGFIGSANIDTNSRLCMSSAVAGYKRAFGSDTVPCDYQDLELADLIVLVGSNTAWCHPVIYQRIRAAREQRGTKIVVIDPRKTATCEFADLHLPIQPGTDALLFNGLLNFLRREDYLDFAFLEAHTEGFAAALDAARASSPTLPSVAQACGLDPASVAEFYRMFARTAATVTLYSQGVNQSSAGVDKNNAIINCHLATGRIGKPGAGPFSITGQPNAMGGREVGGLANQLAAHMDFDAADNIDRVARFWGAPGITRKPGYKAVDLFDAIHDGRVKAVWIVATNPAVSLPDANKVRAALQKCEFVVVSDCIRATDTAQYAHVLLPALGWGEKDGSVTNSERRISRQRAFLNVPGEARPDWWMFAQVAQRMGYAAAFSYDTPAQIFREHAQLSAFENDGRRDFNLAGLVQIDDAKYRQLQPVQWPVHAGEQDAPRLFSDGKFFTPNRKARLIPITPRAPVHATNAEYPLILNTGRVRDHWHTMTRTGKAPRLNAHEVEPCVTLHTRDAQQCGVRDGALAHIGSRWGSIVARVRVSDEQRMGSVFVPIHWNDQFASNAAVDRAVNPVVDAISGQPESKHTPVCVTPHVAAWYGFLLSRRLLVVPQIDYWVRAKGQGYYRYELASDAKPGDWADWARALLCHSDGKAEWSEFLDQRAGRYRAARIVNNRLESCLFISPEPSLPSRTWLAGLFEQDILSDAARASVLAGKPRQGDSDAGEVVCACFGVGSKTIQRAIEQ
ncbi:MAG: nitrate reductase, partial [Gammaproteobacteria bacterium]|nr:nitrate reductase [Gammaproteobacteria bacterium]